MRYWAHADTEPVGDVAEIAAMPLERASEAREAVRRWYPARGSEIAETRDSLRHKAICACCATMRATFDLLAALGVTQSELDAAMRGDADA